MCGVIGLIYGQSRDDLGKIAAELLQTLEYRGYDSTGAAVQGDDDRVQLVKGVGAPSLLVNQLGIVDMAGRVLCGQVRWATFGVVNEVNSQPHVVDCRVHIYGAHNGNVTNCDDLQAWLRDEGHTVLSDNDGEMLVHTVEHYFAMELQQCTEQEQQQQDVRKRCMRGAILRAQRKLQGSYAAVVIDPQVDCVWAIKSGSSLYFGIGGDDEASRFGVTSSDLSSVLKLTRVVVPLREGEFVEYDAHSYQVYQLAQPAKHGAQKAPGTPLSRQPVRSRLRAKDIALLPPFETFMDQEISAQENTCRNVVTLFDGGSAVAKQLSSYINGMQPEQQTTLAKGLNDLRDQYSDDKIAEHFQLLVAGEPLRLLRSAVPVQLQQDLVAGTPAQLADKLGSSDAALFADLLAMATGIEQLVSILLLDAMVELEEVAEFSGVIDGFVEKCQAAIKSGGSIFVVSCGTSYHAAKAASLFFNEIAGVEVIPILPGEYRGQYSRALKDGDLFVAISQSGETKDLIDIVNDIIASGKRVGRVAIVNNVNSTLAQEKSQLAIPLRCGPEIAVPATKSFINQMAVCYCLALRLAERRIADKEGEEKQAAQRLLREQRHKFSRLPALIRDTFDRTDADVEKAAQMLFLAPSMHILATRIGAVAKEGALKVREVVLNHTEGCEGSEFKHGPNTILGFNTLFGPLQVDALLKKVGRVIARLMQEARQQNVDTGNLRSLIQAVTDSVFSPTSTPFALSKAQQALLDQVFHRSEFLDELYADYPLIYVTGPEERDVLLTVSQINTHKIRGASTVVIAEDHPAIRQAASKAPANHPTYRSVFVSLPRTNDTLLVVFSSTVVLQRLALKMSLLKMAYLDRLAIPDHGVHPDVPKNVSKSITVD